MNCSIRIATTDDVDAIAEIGRTTFARAYGEIVLPGDMTSYGAKHFSPELIRSEIVSKAATYFIAEADQAVAGYAKIAETANPEQLAHEKTIELQRLYVAAGHCGKGIGDKLFTAVTQSAVASAYTALWLQVWEKNAGAIAFYEKAGLQRFGIEPYLIGTTANPVVLMYKILSPGHESAT